MGRRDQWMKAVQVHVIHVSTTRDLSLMLEEAALAEAHVLSTSPPHSSSPGSPRNRHDVGDQNQAAPSTPTVPLWRSTGHPRPARHPAHRFRPVGQPHPRRRLTPCGAPRDASVPSRAVMSLYLNPTLSQAIPLERR
jgi:hypothetical protein